MLVLFFPCGYRREEVQESREWSKYFGPLLSFHAPLSQSICQSPAEGWQLLLPLVSLPPHHVIAADDTKTIVQPEKGLACTC